MAQLSPSGSQPSTPRTARIALIGNPNIGKTTLFNTLTGMRQRVGNYPGVTVSKKVGLLKHGQGMVSEVIDLPGTYSLAASSLDERVVVDVLAGHGMGLEKPDLVVCVVDASNLKRNLFLAAQVAELELPMLIVLNQWDVAKRKGMRIDCALLSERLGVPVVPCVATHQKDGVRVAHAINEALDNPKTFRRIAWPPCVQEALKSLTLDLPPHINPRLDEGEVQRVLFDAHSAILDRIDWPEDQRHEAIESARKHLLAGGYNPMAVEALLHYENLANTLKDVVHQSGELPRSRSEAIDRVLVHRGWGLAIFAVLMYGVFLAVYTGAGPFMELIESGKGWLQGALSPRLAGMPMLGSLVTDGAIEGVGAFLVFLPQILVLFLFIALLEDTGYMARAAFLMDKLFSWCGLNGKSFVPLLSSYACAVPGIMATRTIDDPKARLATILIAPLMSCSARLPVYILMIGAFIEPRYGAFTASWVLFGMHFVGLAIALPLVWFFNRFLLKTKPQPFVLELPPYRLPRWRDVAWRMIESGLEFVQRAGTIIFAITIVIWALLYFPRPTAVEDAARTQFIAEQAASAQTDVSVISERLATDGALQQALSKRVDSSYLEQSFMGRLGKGLQPIFAAAGFDWRVTVGVLASFPAREVIISTLGVIYSLGGDVDEESGSLREAMVHSTWPSGPRAGQPVFIIPVVFGIMVFFALCSQCGATLAVIRKEASTRWAVFSFFYMTALAWLGAVLCYQLGTMVFT